MTHRRLLIDAALIQGENLNSESAASEIQSREGDERRVVPFLGGQEACGPTDKLGPEITLANVSGEGEGGDVTPREGNGEKSILAVGQERTVLGNQQGFAGALEEAGRRQERGRSYVSAGCVPRAQWMRQKSPSQKSHPQAGSVHGIPPPVGTGCRAILRALQAASALSNPRSLLSTKMECLPFLLVEEKCRIWFSHQQIESQCQCAGLSHTVPLKDRPPSPATSLPLVQGPQCSPSPQGAAWAMLPDPEPVREGSTLQPAFRPGKGLASDPKGRLCRLCPCLCAV